MRVLNFSENYIYQKIDYIKTTFGEALKRDELKSFDCVKVIRGKHKGKIGIFEGIDYNDYRAVRVVLNGEHNSIPILLSNLEKCYK